MAEIENEQEWQEEAERVRVVAEKIAERVHELERETKSIKEEVVEIRKNFWEDVTVNLSNSDDLVETHFAIRQQAEVLSERERRHRYSVQVLKKLRRLVDSPYFGRVDFIEAGQKTTEKIYLGITSFKDAASDEFLVYDWRAPISSIYYDSAPGEVTYKAPFGYVSGEMTRKRQFSIQGQQLRFMFDTGVTIGDEMLMQVLSNHSDAQMKSIVSTIQKEQNSIIRNDSSRLLIVQGAAGSGKTSAALQRVAYLLYKYRDTLHANEIVLFSPNPLFNSYVSTVLPELGEENMQQTTFQAYLEHRLGAQFEIEDPFGQLEYLLSETKFSSEATPEYVARIGGIQFKSSTQFLAMMNAYQAYLEQAGMKFVSLVFEERVIVSSEQMTEKFYALHEEKHGSLRVQHRVDLLREWLLKELSIFISQEIHASWVEDEIELLSQDDYQKAFQQLERRQKRKDATFDDAKLEREILGRMVVKRHLRPLQRRIKALQFVDVKALYRNLFENQELALKLAEMARATVEAVDEIGGDGTLRIPSSTAGLPTQHWSEICALTIQQLDANQLLYEDATPYLYLAEMLQGQHVNTSVRHVFVDEAQDYSPFQLEFLKRLFPRSKMTALGDLNQAIYAHESAFGEFSALAKLYGEKHTELMRLTKSYRSTEEIVAFTRGMIPGGEAIEPFHRHGAKPQVVTFDLDVTASPTQSDGIASSVVAPTPALAPLDARRVNAMIADITGLQEMGYASIAIICKTAEESSLAHDVLHASGLQSRLITKYSPTFAKETVVIPAYLAKGVEFDAVIIYDASERHYARPLERKLFYTACTRAMHELKLYVSGEVSPFITEQPAETYECIAGA